MSSISPPDETAGTVRSRCAARLALRGILHSHEPLASSCKRGHVCAPRSCSTNRRIELDTGTGSHPDPESGNRAETMNPSSESADDVVEDQIWSTRRSHPVHSTTMQ
ncbi:hypothetical protein [Klebsiella pneumoniae]|uniref:hypothetical protein n=1 Tax=Klebsiella pneumoniae TaxID=573 RepID=UPI003C12FAA3